MHKCVSAFDMIHQKLFDDELRSLIDLGQRFWHNNWEKAQLLSLPYSIHYRLWKTVKVVWGWTAAGCYSAASYPLSIWLKFNRFFSPPRPSSMPSRVKQSNVRSRLLYSAWRFNAACGNIAASGIDIYIPEPAQSAFVCLSFNIGWFSIMERRGDAGNESQREPLCLLWISRAVKRG
jgi:hypothetical protein